MARDLFEEAGIAGTGGRDLFADAGIAPPTKKRSIGDIAGDMGVTALKGAVGLPQAAVGIADLATGGRAGKAVEDAGVKFGETQNTLDTWYSEAQQAANRKVAEADGFTETLKAAVENPSVIAKTVVESVPLMLGGAGIARGIMKGAEVVGKQAAPWVAGALGEGAIGAGSAAESIRGETEDGLLTGKQALAAGGAGLGTAILGAAGGKLAQRFGFGDIDTILAQGGPDAVAAGAAKQGFLRQVASGGISEGVFEELPQSIQEQMWQNYALDKPLTDGVGNAAAMGLLAGGVMGGVGGGYNAFAGKPAPAPKLDTAPATGQEPPVAPAAGPGEAFTPEEVAAFRRDQAANQGQMWRGTIADRVGEIRANQQADRLAQADADIAAGMAEFEADQAKAQLGDGAIGRAAAAGIDSGAIAPEQVTGIGGGSSNMPEPGAALVQQRNAQRDQKASERNQPVQGGATNGTAGSGTPILARPGSESGVDLNTQGLPAAVVQPAGNGLDTATGKPASGSGSDLAAGSAAGGQDAVTTKTGDQNVQVQGQETAQEVSDATQPEQVAKEEGKAAGKKGASGGTLAEPDAVAPPSVATPETVIPEPGTTVPNLSIGTLPNSAEPITVKNGVVHIGKYAAQNFETGEDVTVPEGANNLAIAKALRDAGAVAKGQKIFGAGGKKDAGGGGGTIAEPAGTPADTTGKADTNTKKDDGEDEHGRPVGWRTNAIKAGKLLKELGIERKKGMKLADMVKAIDEHDIAANANENQAAAEKYAAMTLDEFIEQRKAMPIYSENYKHFDDMAQAKKDFYDQHLDFIETALENGIEIDQKVIDSFAGIEIDQKTWPMAAAAIKSEVSKPEKKKRTKKDTGGAGTPADTGTAPEPEEKPAAEKPKKDKKEPKPEPTDAEQAAAKVREAVEGSDIDWLATEIYKGVLDADQLTGDDLPIVFPDDRLIRVAVRLDSKPTRVEGNLKKLGFRITDKLQETEQSERIVISAILTKAAGLDDAGKELGGKVKDQKPPKVADSDEKAFAKEVDKWLDTIKKGNILDPESNANQTFGAQMYKEAIFDRVQYPLAYLATMLKKHYSFYRANSDKEVLISAMKDSERAASVTKFADQYVATLTKMQELLHAQDTVAEASIVLLTEYLSLGSTDADFILTESGKPLETIMELGSYRAGRTLFNHITSNAQVFGKDENSTDQTHRVVKKDPDTPPRLENIVRVGMKDHRQGKDVDTDDFMAAFGFAGVEFGEWVNQIERQQNLNLAYDSLHDLADMIGFDPKIVGLANKLGMAIGARGSKNTRAAAHYEPANNVINLTKTKGNGTVGHEWFHGLDHNLKQLSSEHSIAVKALAKALGDRINAGKVQDFLRGKLRDASGEKNRTLPPKDAIFQLLNPRDRYSRPLHETLQQRTDFMGNARKLDEGRSEPYWSTPHEMLARGFESFVHDKANGGTPYLVGPSRRNGVMTPKNGFKGTPYPMNDERQYVADLYKDFFDLIDGATLELKKYKAEPRTVHVDGLGYAVVDQHGLGLGQHGGYPGTLFWHKDEADAKESADTMRAKERVLDAVSKQVGATNKEMLDFAEKIDEIMDELGIIRWPEIKNGSMVESMFFHLRQGWWPKDNRELKEYVAKAHGVSPTEIDLLKLKHAQEDFEAALARFANQRIVDMRASGADDKAIFDEMLALYEKQPNLDVRTSTSSANQAYSTPLPISFMAGLLGRVQPKTKVVDPTGGNGMLLINANPKNTTTIELEPRRANNMRLMQIGRVIEGDATKKIDEINDQAADTVLTNPPFGTMAVPVGVPSWNGKTYQMGKIDHLIAARALRTMADKGRAVIILGANKKVGAVTMTDRVFLNWLHSNYNVADHFEVEGSLYSRQGADWPLRVLVIAGRKHAETAYDMNKPVERVFDYDQLWSRYVQAATNSERILVDTSAQPSGAGSEDNGRGSVPRGDLAEAGNADLGGRDGTGASNGGFNDGGTGGPGTPADTAARSGTTGESADGKGGRGQPGKNGQPGTGKTGGRRTGGVSGTGAKPTDAGGLSDLDDAEIAGIFDDVFGESKPAAKKKAGKKSEAGEPKKGTLRQRIARNKSTGDAELDAIFSDLDKLVDEQPAGQVGQTAAPDASRAAGEDGIDGPMFSRVSEDEEFDPAKYEAYKPIFQRIMDVMRKKFSDVKEQIRNFAKMVMDRYGAKIKAYAQQFVADRKKSEDSAPSGRKPIVTDPVDSESQVVYRGRSQGDSGGIYVPRRQADALYSSLDRVEAEYGDIDQFVRDELGYDSNEKMYKALGGYQIDAIALAIAEIKNGNGFIIGDDTGVGKGRTAAAIIAWAVKNDKIPVFFTIKPELFSAMLEDLQDIDKGDIKLAITNTNEVIKDNKGKVVLKSKPAEAKALYKHLIDNNALPGGAQALFTNYSQVNDKGDSLRKQAIAGLVKSGKAVIIMDEAHNAAGDSNIGTFIKGLITGEGLFGVDSDGNGTPPPDDFTPPPVAYLSATFAKRPDNIPVYVRTHLSKAADSMEELVNAFAGGGDVLQQIASEMLVKAGSMIRRERSYEGVSFDFVTDDSNAERDERQVDAVTDVLRTIVRADRAFAEWIKSQEGKQALEQLVPPGYQSYDKDGRLNTAINHALFTSIAHNYIGQLLLATKIDTAINHVTGSINRGEKPVLALQNTMESALKDYADMAGVKSGDELTNYGWQTVLKRGATAARRVSFKADTGDKKDGIRVVVPMNLLPPLVAAEFHRAEQMIEDFQSELPASPIDMLRFKLSQYSVVTDKDGKQTVTMKPPAGANTRPLIVSEITGRDMAVDYSTPIPTLTKRDDPDAVDVVQGYGNGKVDVVILNSSGSTGISLHASEKFKDQRPRRMIILQPNPDIAVFKQTIGRIHRTGQVEWPSFTVLATSIPAERRILAILKKKMKSLFSNTSSGKGSTEIDAIDFINRYGDRIVAEYMQENEDAAEFIGMNIPDTKDAEGTEFSQSASNRITLLSVDEQRSFFDTVEQRFTQEIEQRNAAGTNTLDMQQYDFQAAPLETMLFEEGMDESNPFTESVFLTKYEINVIGDIPNPEKVQAAIDSALAGRKPVDVIEALANDFKTQYDESYNQMVLRQQQLIADRNKADITPSELKDLEARSATLETIMTGFSTRREQTLSSLKQRFPIGAIMHDMAVGDVESDGVVIGYSVGKITSKTGNPFAPSNIRVHIQRNVPNGRITIPLSQLENGAGVTVPQDYDRWARLDEVFAMRNVSGGKTQRYIVTGNLVRFRSLETGGDIIKFTLDGSTEESPRIESGILMPEKWKPEAEMKSNFAFRSKEAAADFALNVLKTIVARKYDSTGYDSYKNKLDAIVSSTKVESPVSQEMFDELEYHPILMDRNKAVKIMLDPYRGDLELHVNPATQARLFKSKELVALVGDLSKKHRKDTHAKVTITDPAKIKPVIAIIYRFTGLSVPEAAVEYSRALAKAHYALEQGGSDTAFSRAAPFYSPLARAIDAAPDKVFGSANGVKLWLAGNAAKLGIKKDEITYSGITEWLDLMAAQHKPITKKVFRGGGASTASSLGKGVTAQDIINYERNELGNSDIAVSPGVDLAAVPAANTEWVTFKEQDAATYGDVEGGEATFVVLAKDNDGGYLVRHVDAGAGKITKADVLAYLNQNGVQVKDVVLGGYEEPDPYDSPDVQVVNEETLPSQDEDGNEVYDETNDKRYDIDIEGERYEITGSDWSGHWWATGPDGQPVGDGFAEYDEAEKAAVDHFVKTFEEKALAAAGTAAGPVDGPTKFASHQLPGGENYRELLLTLPEALPTELPNGFDVRKFSNTSWGVFGPGPLDENRYASGPSRAEALQTFYRTHGNSVGVRTFRSSHFDQPNILAHVRFNERTDADGKKVLFIEEIQSDWGQKGKKEGFGGKAELPDDYTIEQGDDGYWRVLDPDGNRAALGKTEQEAIERTSGHHKAGGIPAAPFVTDTKAWVGLALKRMIAYAAENGFDRVAWTTGDQQAARYDLSKHVDFVTARWELKTKTWRLEVGYAGNRRSMDTLYPTDDALADYVGKDLAEKIIADRAEASGDGKIYRGLDLKVGGEGMKAFYDQIVPQVANDILKKLGGGKVGSVAVATFDKTEADRMLASGEIKSYADMSDYNARSQPGFDITPAMKEHAAGGLPMFKADSQLGISKPARPAIAKVELDAVVRRITARWKRPKGDTAGRVIAVESATDLPAAVLKTADAQNVPHEEIRAVFHQGHIYLVRENIKDVAAVEEAIFHEAYGHYGARLLAGGDIAKMNQTFSALWKRVGELDGVRKMAREFGVERKIEPYIRSLAKSNLPIERRNQIIMDELLAHIAGKGDFGFRVRVKAYIGALRQALRNLAKKMGLDGLAKRLEAFTDTELLNMLRQQRLAVINGGPGGGGTQFMRNENALSYEYEVPADNARATPIDRAELAALRRAAAGIESPEKGITFHIADDGRAIVTGPARTKVPARFARFAQENNLTLVVRRSPARVISAGSDPAQGRNPQASKFYGTAMPLEYRESGALYFGEMGDDHIDRTGNTRFSRVEIIGDSGRQYTPEQEAAMRRTGSTETIRTPKEVLKDLWKDAGKKLAQGLVDQFRPVRDIDAHAYTLMRLSKGSSGAFEAFMHHGKLSLRDGAYDADTTGGVLEQVFNPLGKESTDFLRWIAGNRAERLAQEDKENLFSPEDIDAFKSLADGVADFDYTLANGKTTRDRTLIYADSLAKFSAFNKNVLDMAEESGLIDGESRQFWEHEFYVPFYRVADEDEGVRGMNVKSGVVRQEAFKQLKGGSNQLNDLLENTLMNWAHLIDASSKNRAARATLEAAAQIGAVTPANAGDKKTVWYKQDGERVFYRVDDPYLMEAISSLEYAGLRGPAMNALSTMKHVLTVGVTASPFFKVRNLIRDSVQAIAVSDLGKNPLGNVKKGFELTDRASQEYVSALAGGGLIRFGTMLESSEAKRTRQLIKQGAKDSHILDDESKVRAFYDGYLEPAIAAYNELGNRGEEINRMALYDQLIKQGKDHATASLLARDLMDFSMQGTWTAVRFLTQVVPFMNARMQGLYKLGRAGKEDPARMATVLGAVTLASLALLAAYGDDDDWKKREDWDRDNYWWFKIAGTAFRIPKPFEIGAIATLAERSAELMFDQEMTGKRFMGAISKLAQDQLAINPVPQLTKPIIDLYANNDSFTGRPIESMGMERLDPDQRYRQSTSMVARGLSTAGNALSGDNFLSPVQIDHVVRAYFGWLGSFVVGGADMLVRGVSNESSKPTADYFKMASGGMVSGLDSARSRYVSQMYDQARELEQAYGTHRNLLKEGRIEEAAEYREEHAEALTRHRSVEFVKRQSTRLNEQIRAIERSDMSPDEKRDRINVLRDRQHEIAKRLSGA